MIKYVEGNLITMLKMKKFDITAHGCNCQNVMGAGIALQLKNNFKEVFDADKEFEEINKNDFYGHRYDKLGQCSHAYVEKHDFHVFNLYTQLNYGRNKQHFEYTALRDSLRQLVMYYNNSLLKLKINCKVRGKQVKIGLPMIGSGLGGGDWKIIEKIIKNELYKFDVTIVKYEK